MSLDFGKLNFSISFNPTSAFPIDARSYFESYADALRAAAGAKPVGSTDSNYYFGQTVVIVENEKAKFYIIQPNHTLSPISGIESIPVNPALFETDANGNLSLKGFDAAALGSVLSVGPDGTLKWLSIYTKEEIDQAIKTAVAASAHLKRKIVDSVDDIYDFMEKHEDADQYIFMVPSGSGEASDKYEEYIVVLYTDDEGIETKYVEKVGSWEVDLSDYSTTKEVKELLEGKVDKVDGSRLITNAEAEKLQSTLHIKSVNGTLNFNTSTGELGVKEVSAEQVNNLGAWITSHVNVVKGLSEENFTTQHAEKLASIQSGAEKNYVRSVSNEFEVTDEGQLNIKSITSAKVSDLSALLREKADADQVASLMMTVNGLSTDVGDLKSRMTWTKI